MNPENNNFDSNLEPQSFGVPTPEQPVVGDPSGFAPFDNLNNESLNVPQDTFNPTPVDPSTFNAGVNAELGSEPVAPVEAPLFDATAAPIEQADTLNVAPTVDVPNEFTYQAEPSIPVDAQPVTMGSEYTESPLDQTITFNQVGPVVSDNLGQVAQEAPAMIDSQPMPVDNVPADAPAQVEAPTGPTLPIPDQMPTTDYQATVSTPVDYATPMSDFDQIGSTPELDPKQKKKGSSKTLLFCLIIILIAALGYGAYYFINVKGIFNSKSVTTKDLEIESGDTLSTSIEDYGTFKDTSSSNCVLDVSKVDTTKAGKYKYTITCGTDTYDGTITVKDTTAPVLSFNIVETKVDIPVTEQEFVVNSLKAGETAEFVNSEEVRESIKTPGFYIVSFKAEDESGNKQQYYAPLSVLSSEIRFNIRGTKKSEDGSTERLIIFCNNETICQAAFGVQIFDFEDKNAYNEMFKTYKGEKEFTYKSYTGVPLFYPEENRLVIITQSGIDFGAQTANQVFEKYKTSGYDMKFSTNGSVDNTIINFNVD